MDNIQHNTGTILILPEIIHIFLFPVYIQEKRTGVKKQRITCISTMYLYNVNDFIVIIFTVFNSIKVTQKGKNMQMHTHGSVPVLQG